MPARMALFLSVMLLVSACGQGTESATTSTSTTISTTTSTRPSTTTTPAPTTTTHAATTTTSRPLDVFYERGQVVGPDRFSFTVGDEVSIWVLSDTEAEIHVHSYDLFFQAKPGVPVEITLTADVPGIFEVELESTHTPLFELEVTS